MKKFWIGLVVIFIMLIVNVNYGHARDVMKCKGGFIETGDKIDELVEKCGNPETSVISIKGRHAYDNWTYNFGPRKFMKKVVLNANGRVVKIKTLGKGY